MPEGWLATSAVYVSTVFLCAFSLWSRWKGQAWACEPRWASLFNPASCIDWFKLNMSNREFHISKQLTLTFSNWVFPQALLWPQSERMWSLWLPLLRFPISIWYPTVCRSPHLQLYQKKKKKLVRPTNLCTARGDEIDDLTLCCYLVVTDHDGVQPPCSVLKRKLQVLIHQTIMGIIVWSLY